MDYCCSFFTIVFTMCLYGQHVLYSLPCETTFAFDLDDFLYRLSFFSPDRRRGQNSWKMKTKRKARENRCPLSRRWTRPSGCTGRQRTTTALNAKRGHARTLTAKARCSWQPRRRLRITATPQERRAEQPGTRRGERKKKTVAQVASRPRHPEYPTTPDQQKVTHGRSAFPISRFVWVTLLFTKDVTGQM